MADAPSPVSGACLPPREGEEGPDPGESPSEGESPSMGPHTEGRKRHRRRPSKKKRRWKPYFKLSWEEKKELDEREAARASRVREEMFAYGLPVAPQHHAVPDGGARPEEPDLKTELGALEAGRGQPAEDTASEEESVEPEEEEDGSGAGRHGQSRDGGGEFLQRLLRNPRSTTPRACRARASRSWCGSTWSWRSASPAWRTRTTG
ncbi:protein HEXIM-like [Huso huso]|uniref:Protein HEXIM-like n=1 Tax=Huso huso TaxID=61971 RepID=A0ABR0YKA0_HUSHU